jgi:hypothetical protein
MTLATVEPFTKNPPRGIPFTTHNLQDSDEFTSFTKFTTPETGDTQPRLRLV